MPPAVTCAFAKELVPETSNSHFFNKAYIEFFSFQSKLQQGLLMSSIFASFKIIGRIFLLIIPMKESWTLRPPNTDQ